MAFGFAALLIGLTAPERERAYTQGGGADTHGRDATPDYGRVFIQDQVSRLDLKIAASDWQIAIDDMTDMAGAAGGQFAGGQQPGGVSLAAGSHLGVSWWWAAANGHARPGLLAGVERGLHKSARRKRVRLGNPPTSGRCVQTGDGGGLAVLFSVDAAPIPPAAAP